MRKALLAIIFLAAVLPLARLAVKPAAGQAAPLRRELSMEKAVSLAFAATGAEAEEFQVAAWMKIGEGAYLPAGELSSLAHRAWEKLSPGREGRGSLREEPYLRGYLQEDEPEPGRRLEVAVQTLAAQPGTRNGRPETYLLAGMTWPAGSPELGQGQRQMEEALRPFSGAPNLSLIIRGSLRGRLTPEEQESIATSAFRSVEAEALEGMAEGELLSRTGYTPLLRKYLEVAGRRANLNVALRYRSLDNRTHVEVGSPLLDGEY